MYAIRAPSPTDRCSFAAKYSELLKSWRSEAAHFLDVERINSAMLIPIFYRQRNVLNFAYWHTMILTHRPFLLSSFARLQRNNNISEQPYKAQMDDSIQECLSAAMNIVDTVDALICEGMMFQAFWVIYCLQSHPNIPLTFGQKFTSYFAFSAVVVLYVYIIQSRQSTSNSHEKYLRAAMRCQDQIFNIAEKGSLASRYCLVLEELRSEATKQSQLSNSQLQQNQTAAIDSVNGHPNVDIPLEFSAGGVGNEFDYDASPSSSLADFASWLQFESMVNPTNFLIHIPI